LIAHCFSRNHKIFSRFLKTENLIAIGLFPVFEAAGEPDGLSRNMTTAITPQRQASARRRSTSGITAFAAQILLKLGSLHGIAAAASGRQSTKLLHNWIRGAGPIGGATTPAAWRWQLFRLSDCCRDVHCTWSSSHLHPDSDQREYSQTLPELRPARQQPPPGQHCSATPCSKSPAVSEVRLNRLRHLRWPDPRRCGGCRRFWSCRHADKHLRTAKPDTM